MTSEVYQSGLSHISSVMRRSSFRCGIYDSNDNDGFLSSGFLTNYFTVVWWFRTISLKNSLKQFKSI